MAQRWIPKLDRFYTKHLVTEVFTELGDGARRMPTEHGENWAWCSNWDAYYHNPTYPVLYLDAHKDTHCERVCAPVVQNDLVLATGHDNRVSCMVLHEIIRDSTLQHCPVSVIYYVLWSDGEETGMVDLVCWLDEDYRRHDRERMVVLDATDFQPTQSSPTNLGGGVYQFRGDPLEDLIPSDSIVQQPCTIRDPYPGNLQYTHAGLLYRRFGVIVSRMGIPVYGVPEGSPATSHIHNFHTLASLQDIEQLYQKTRIVCQRAFL